ncbi:MAG: DUF3592 domain-containing protein [Acidobacteriota bacterium]
MQQRPVLGPPPRHVPFSLILTNCFNPMTQVLFVAVGFAMVFFWVFAMHADFPLFTFRGPIERAGGRVTGVVDTHASSNRQHIYANHYVYPVGGTELTGVSYGDEKEVGEAVMVEYREADPASSRIEGMRQQEFGSGAAIVIIFPLLFGLFLMLALQYGWNQVRLLRRGEVTDATLRGRNLTRRNSVRLNFEFATLTGAKAAAFRIVYDPKWTRSSPQDEYRDGLVESVLYDPENPSSNTMLLDKGTALPFDADGQLTGRPLAALASLILPTLFLYGNAWAACARFGIHALDLW